MLLLIIHKSQFVDVTNIKTHLTTQGRVCIYGRIAVTTLLKSLRILRLSLIQLCEYLGLFEMFMDVNSIFGLSVKQDGLQVAVFCRHKVH
jgi:hypothetical protein